MRTLIVVAFAAFLLAGCTTNPTQHSSASATDARDGGSMATAILVKAQDEGAGVGAEYQWLAQHFPGYERGGQALLSNNGHFYDVIDITTAFNEQKKIYFDITSYFGKW